jgi:membrane protein YqaA with SNARE-associated domain
VSRAAHPSPPYRGGPPLLTLHAGLFASALLSATILPGASEAVVLALLIQGLDPWHLLLTATAGNVAGSVLNWWLGRHAMRYRERRWFPVGPEQLARVQGWYHRWGYPSLLLAWVPGVGDALTLVAGAMRAPLPVFLALVTIAKGLRYAVVIGLTEGTGLT